MNRNVESHFANLPSAHIERSRFDRSQDVKMTFNVGEIIPFYIDEVLPGDTFEVTTSKVVRLHTLLTPVMDNIYLDTYFFFVPNRLLWPHWKNFMGESDKAWLPEVEYAVPGIGLGDDTAAGDGAVQVGDILDYMGVPTGVSAAIGSTKIFYVNSLPLKAYWKCYNDWFRDENLIDVVNVPDNDTNYLYNWYATRNLTKPAKAAKYHDYFTSSLPNRAKLASLGDPFQAGSVGVPIYGYGNNIPVGTGSIFNTNYSSTLDALHFAKYHDGTSKGYAGEGVARNSADDGSVSVVSRVVNQDQFTLVPDNLYADISQNPMIGLTDIVSLRYALAGLVRFLVAYQL